MTSNGFATLQDSAGVSRTPDGRNRRMRTGDMHRAHFLWIRSLQVPPNTRRRPALCLVLALATWHSFGATSIRTSPAAIRANTPLQARTLAYEDARGTKQSGYVVFRPIKGTPFLGNVCGSSQNDLLFADLSEKGATLTIVDGNATRVRRVVDTGVTGQPVFRLLQAGDRAMLISCTLKELTSYTCCAQGVVVRRYALPAQPLLIDSGRFSGDNGRDDVVMLTKTRLYIGRLGEDLIRWESYAVPDSFYTRWSRYAEPEAFFCKAGHHIRLTLDLNRDGLDDLILPDVRHLTILWQAQDNTLQMCGVDLPMDLLQVYREHFSQQLSYRHENRIGRWGQFLQPYDIILSPASEFPKSDGLYLRRSQGDREYRSAWTHIVWSGGQCRALIPEENDPRRHSLLLRKDSVHSQDQWLIWAPKTMRLLKPNAVEDMQSSYCIDIDGDEIPDLLETTEDITASGPVAHVSYRFGRRSPEGVGTGDGRPRPFRGNISFNSVPDGRFTSSNWLSFTAGSVCDVNGDGALDVVLMRPEIEPEILLSGRATGSIAPCVYAIWLFDKVERNFSRRNLQQLVVKQTLGFHRPVIAHESHPGTAYLAMHDFGDLNGDRYEDLVFALTRDRLGICLNTGTHDKCFDCAAMVELKISRYDGLVAVDFGSRTMALCWDKSYNYTIVASDGVVK